jgi:hypothetical protein
MLAIMSLLEATEEEITMLEFFIPDWRVALFTAKNRRITVPPPLRNVEKSIIAQNALKHHVQGVLLEAWRNQ